MNTHMLEHPAVQRNLAALASRGVRFVEPGEGFLACGWVGKGRLAEPDDVVTAADQLLRGDGPLRGRRLIVSAGPTFEDLDPGALRREPIERPHGVRASPRKPPRVVRTSCS